VEICLARAKFYMLEWLSFSPFQFTYLRARSKPCTDGGHTQFGFCAVQTSLLLMSSWKPYIYERAMSHHKVVVDYSQTDSPYDYEILNKNWIDQRKQNRNNVVLWSASCLMYWALLHMYWAVHGDSVAILSILHIRKYPLLYR
jgi:hypothetical protein